MQIKELRKDYEEYSAQVGDLNRKLIYTGIAVIWLFRISLDNSSTTLPNALHVPLLMLVFSFSIEFVQKIYQTLATYFQYLFFRHKHKCSSNVEDVVVQEKEWIASIGWILWLLKFIPTIYAYYLLGKFLSLRISEIGC